MWPVIITKISPRCSESPEASGGRLTAFETYTTDNAEDFRPQLERIKKSGAEVLFLPDYPRDVILQVQQARQMALKATIIGSDSWEPTLLAGHVEFEGTFCSGHWHADMANAQSRAFIESYTRRYGRPPRATPALTYDAFGLLMKAIQAQQRTDPDAIRNGLYTMAPHKGVSGIIAYRDNGDPVKSAVIIQIKGGQNSFYTLINPE